VAAAEAVFVHPLDSVSGFLIADDGTTRRWTGGGILFPGPDSRHVWRATGADSETSLTLFEVQGDRATSTRLELPAADATLVPDGQGYALAYASGGLYALRPTGITRISNGEVIAAGPNRLLASRCDQQARCLPVVLDQRFQPLEPQPALQVEELGEGLSGVISADGRVAALTTDSPEDSLRLLDLRTGASRRIDLRTRSSRSYMTSQVAFSPDSRWLFVAGSDYRAHAVDVRTGEIRTLARHVTAVDQVAVRPQP
jgi:WD40 repeat protein